MSWTFIIWNTNQTTILYLRPSLFFSTRGYYRYKKRGHKWPKIDEFKMNRLKYEIVYIGTKTFDGMQWMAFDNPDGWRW